MGSISKGVLMKGYGYAAAMWHSYKSNSSNCFSFPKVGLCVHHKLFKFRSCSSTITRSSLQPPDVSRLAKTAQISLTPIEVEEFGPKIHQVIDWFGQLQGVDLQSIEPSIRAESENNLRDNASETFDHRDAMVAAVPSYEEPFIKVPKVLSMD